MNITFMCMLGKSASETLSALQQIYGDTALKKSAVYDWLFRFKNGHETLEDDQRSGRLLTSRTAGMIENVRQLIHCHRRMTIVEMAQEIGISIGSIHAILSDLKMRRVSAKFVPRQLTTDQKDCSMRVTGDLFEKSTQDPTILTKIVTADESWVFAYDPGRRCIQQSGTHRRLPDQRNHTSSSPRKK
jgi:hypothetical protein